MYKTTIQQIILFVITSVIIFQSGKRLIALDDIKSFTDFGVIILFFITSVFFLNCFIRLSSKFLDLLRF